MGHQPGFPCLYSPDDHTGRCSTPVIPPPADLSATRYFGRGSESRNFYRINGTAPWGMQVEFRDGEGNWHTSVMPTVEAFLSDIEGSMWREITAAEVPTLSEEDRREIAVEVHQERTEDARSRYEENPDE